MSLSRACIRMVAVMAIRETTWSDVEVNDSNNAPIGQTAEDAAKPFVTVFTDTDFTAVSGRELDVGDERNLHLVIEFGLSGPPPLSDPTAAQPPAQMPEVPQTDQAFEIVVDVLERHADKAFTGNPNSELGEVWRGLVNSIKKTTSMRGGSAQSSVRWAARQKVFELDIVGDPAPGVVIDDAHPIARAVALGLASGDVGLVNVATLIKAELTTPAAPTWQQVQAQLGLTTDEVADIGLQPLGDPQAVPAQDVTLEDTDA